MANLICYSATNCDEKIAKELGISTDRIPTLRGLYANRVLKENSDGQTLVNEFDTLIAEANEGNESSLQKLVEIVATELETARQKDAKSIELVSTNLAEDFMAISEYPVRLRNDFIDFLVEQYSEEATYSMRANPSDMS